MAYSGDSTKERRKSLSTLIEIAEKFNIKLSVARNKAYHVIRCPHGNAEHVYNNKL